MDADVEHVPAQIYEHELLVPNLDLFLEFAELWRDAVGYQGCIVQSVTK